MKRSSLAALLLVVTAGVLAAQAEAHFGRGVAYYLMNDLELAQRSFEAYWRSFPQPTIRAGFTLLLANDKWEATKKFKDYLDSDHRSLPALIGISLAIADMKNTNVIESLYRPLRLDPEYAPAYLCLGYEFLKRRDYPAAEDNFGKAVKFGAVPEFKLALTDLYLQTGQAQKALDLIKPEADRTPDNFYFNLFTLRALFQLNQLPAMGPYLEQALVCKPGSREALLFKARYLVAGAEYRKAKAVLENLKFDNYNPEYSLVFAEVLLRLRDRNAEKYLYEVFSQNRWNPTVNRLLGVYHLQRKDQTVQSWIDRALLSGVAPAELQKEFPAGYRFSETPFFAAFDIRKIHWLDNRTLLLAGREQSGGSESLLVLDTATSKVLKSFKYQGAIQELFASPQGDRIIFSTTATENEKVYVYAFLWQPPRNIVLRPVIGYALAMPGITAGYVASGGMVYFTDKSVADMAFDSPFATVGSYGKRSSIFPRYPFPVFRYNFATDQFAEVKDANSLRGIPVADMQRYFLVADAYERNADVKAMIEKGQGLEITSSDVVHIVFDEACSGFIVYYADLKNAFQALVYDKARSRAERVDETMFLGKNRFAEGDVFRFDPGRKEIFFLTRDKEKALYVFNYGSRLFRKAGNPVLEAAFNESTRSLLLLSERTRYLYYTETNPEVVCLEPFSRRPLGARRDFEKILRLDDFGRASFATFNGELVNVDENAAAVRVGVAPHGAPFRESPDGKRVAVFINGRLYVLPWIG